MLGRADIEGSKSNVAMNAWLPQASYPCGNFSVTSNRNLFGCKGSLGLAFAPLSDTVRECQSNFSPCGPQEVSVLHESNLGHLRCNLADVPPQPNSPSEGVPHSRQINDSDSVSGMTPQVVVFHRRFRSHVLYTPRIIRRRQTRVKLNRVFFPRLCYQARSLGCGFARM